MNPYASYLEDRDPIEVMRSTPSDLQAIVARLTPEQIEAPTAPGKWSVREILAHMADCEVVWAFRIRQALETPGATVTPFDQDVWATRYAAYTADAAMQTFVALRAWNLALLETVSTAEKETLLTHPERGTFPMQEMLESIGGHDRNHVTRLQTLFP